MSFDTYVRLIDLSRYQEGPNDFAKLIQGGYAGAVTRWGVGTYRDPTRVTNLERTIAAGGVPGTYLVPGANTGSGTEQAERFVAEVRAEFGNHPMLYVGDIEHSNSFGDPSAALTAAFFAAGHRLTGRQMGGYIPKWYMDGHGWTAAQVAAIAPHAWWWQSRYRTSPDLTNPPDGAGYKGWPLRAWQWTSSGPAPGIPGDVDKNVYYGTLAQLRAAAGYAAPTTPPPPTPPQPEDDMQMLVKYSDQAPWLITDGTFARWVKSRAEAAELRILQLARAEPDGTPFEKDQGSWLDDLVIVGDLPAGWTHRTLPLVTP